MLLVEDERGYATSLRADLAGADAREQGRRALAIGRSRGSQRGIDRALRRSVRSRRARARSRRRASGGARSARLERAFRASASTSSSSSISRRKRRSATCSSCGSRASAACRTSRPTRVVYAGKGRRAGRRRARLRARRHDARKPRGPPTRCVPMPSSISNRRPRCGGSSPSIPKRSRAASQSRGAAVSGWNV